MSVAMSVSVVPITAPGMCYSDSLECYEGTAVVAVPELSAKSGVPSVVGAPAIRGSPDGFVDTRVCVCDAFDS